MNKDIQQYRIPSLVSAGDSMRQMSEHFELLSAPFATCLHWSLVLWRCLDQMANLLSNNQLQPVLPCCRHASQLSCCSLSL